MSHKRLELFFLCFTPSWAGAARLDLRKGLPTALKFFHDGGPGRGPDARFRIGIPRGQKLRNGLPEIVHTDKDAPPNPFPGQFAKPAFDQIQPTGTGRNKMRDEAGDVAPASAAPGDVCAGRSCPSRQAASDRPETLGPAAGEISGTPDGDAAPSILRPPCRRPVPTRPRAWSSPGACRRASSFRSDRA